MAKRFTDSEKWKKTWFRKLSPEFKCLWVYICDNCNIAGIWDVDFETASYFIGIEIDPLEAKTAFKKQYRELNCGGKWLIVDFIPFQYGVLKDNQNFHRAVNNLLKTSGAAEGQTRGCQGALEKDKEKDTTKDKVKEGV